MRYHNFLKDQGQQMTLKPQLPGRNGKHWTKIDFTTKTMVDYPYGYFNEGFAEYKLVKIFYCVPFARFFFYFNRHDDPFYRLISVPQKTNQDQTVYEYHVNDGLILNSFWLGPFNQNCILHKTYDIVASDSDLN